MSMIDNKIDNRTEDKLTSTHIVIHSSATGAALWAATVSTLPIIGPLIGGMPVLTGINIGMVISIGSLFGHSFESGFMIGLIGQILSMTLGATLLRSALSIIPGVGSVSNAAITFGVTEALGWASYLIFKEGKDITKLSQDEIKDYMDRGKNYAGEVKGQFAWLNELPPHIKAQYDHLTRKLAGSEISDEERQAILREIDELLRPYKPL